MSLSVNGYGQQALLYQLSRRNGGSQAAPAEDAPVATPPRAVTTAASSSADSVSISSALAEFLSLLGGSLAAVTEPAASSTGATAPSDFEATLASVETDPATPAEAAPTAPLDGAADLASVLDAYAAIASGGG